MFQHTAARKRLLTLSKRVNACTREFQHTAARKRLQATISPPSLTCGFQHTAARKRLLQILRRDPIALWFQHTAARKRLQQATRKTYFCAMFQHTAARKRLPNLILMQAAGLEVSTHSRAEAAACGITGMKALVSSFNTQPRGSGCWHTPTNPH